MLLTKKQGLRSYLLQRKFVSIAAGHVVVMGVLAAVLLNNAFGTHVFGAYAFAPCPAGDKTYTVQAGDTLGAIAARNQTTWQSLASHNKLMNANALFINQNLCIPANLASVGMNVASKSNMSAVESTQHLAASNVKGYNNIFSYGQCTWWADERYRQLHGTYVPWTNNANAAQWASRAAEYNWHVSSQPVRGSIIVLQPGVQGAWGTGHVGVVEQVMGSGHVIASNMNWGYSSQVVDVQFNAGPGVSFVSNY
ncbi:MAG: LysM peptidoglycan-binding domain-containing protein [Ktedonobacteraceae bacterium]|nr:LysM peptidoglycan-binding domain-containing protein [Ktedonobacteraceae bacterium]